MKFQPRIFLKPIKWNSVFYIFLILQGAFFSFSVRAAPFSTEKTTEKITEKSTEKSTEKTTDPYQIPDVEAVMNSKQSLTKDELGFSLGYLTGDPFTRYLGYGFEWIRWKDNFFRKTDLEDPSRNGIVFKAKWFQGWYLKIRKDLYDNYQAKDKDFSDLKNSFSIGFIRRPYYSKAIWMNSKPMTAELMYSFGAGVSQFSEISLKENDSENKNFFQIYLSLAEKLSLAERMNVKLEIEYNYFPTQNQTYIQQFGVNIIWVYNLGSIKE